ncbi:hypothetical protein [Clostridium sp.]|uniref:hypothetical protein n=1 Tax=Clostridium sp. TaxID=1506 RepID=UPI002605168A|nr:hypothetical protein [Clostridium sp.]
MADNINVNAEPTPIQRNAEDVAIELTQLYYEKGDYTAPITIEKIQETYSKFYATARVMKEYGRKAQTFTKLEEMLPEKLR